MMSGVTSSIYEKSDPKKPQKETEDSKIMSDYEQLYQDLMIKKVRMSNSPDKLASL